MHFAIVSYTFPPSNEIGGRRWSKFSQQLILKGNKVSIITSDDFNQDYRLHQSEFEKIDIIVLPKLYPKWLSGEVHSVFEKIAYFITTKIINRLTNRNLFDKGVFWGILVSHHLKKLHKKKSIDVLIVTGSPFSLLYYGAKFKLMHPEIFYIADLRDPWTWGSLYGFPFMSDSKRKFQELLEAKSVQYSDLFCVPLNT